MENIKSLLGKRIKELRRERNLSQEKLAENIGIDPNNLSRIENGKNYPSAETIVKIANSLNDEKFGRQLYKFYMLIKE